MSDSITMKEALMLDISDLRHQLAAALCERDEAREQLRLANIDCFSAQAELNEAREALREIAAADWRTSGELRGMARRALETTK